MQNNQKKIKIIEKQLKFIEKQEQRLLSKKDPGLVKLKVNPLLEKIQGMIPDKLNQTLRNSFYKGFLLVFEKGTPFIEKTYNKAAISQEHDVNNYALVRYPSKRNIKKMDRPAGRSKLVNSSIAVVEGGVLGFLGIGLPDIPLFLAVMIKSINEISLSYGYSYEGDEEKAYILNLICGALALEDEQKEYMERADELGAGIDAGIITEINLNQDMKETADILTDALLAAKFIQGIPVVGMIGGVVNHSIIKKVSNYARLKYKKRYLCNQLYKNR